MTVSVWVPGRVSPTIALIIHLSLFAASLVRGADYLAGDSALSARRLSLVESAAPLSVWGVLFIVSAAIGFVAVAVRNTNGVIIGHSLNAGLYAAFAVGLFWDAWRRMEWPPPLSSWGAAVVAVSLLIACLAIMRWNGALRITYSAGIIMAVGLAVVAVPVDALRNCIVLVAMAFLHGALAAGNAMDRPDYAGIRVDERG